MKYKLFIAVILLLCFIPSAGMFLANQDETGGNEILAPPPVLRDAEGNWNMEYLSQLGDYVEDSYFPRQKFVTAWSALNRDLLHTSIADNVVLGKDGWLYFGGTLDDYAGVNPMSEREIFAAARNLKLINEFCQGQGAEFLFAIAPNKNSLYPEHMPDLTVSGKPRNAERLLRELDVQKVPYLDFFSLFQNQEETLYFTQDSHWNAKGAALAADALNNALGRDSDYFMGPFAPEDNHLSDLYDMLCPAGGWLETDLVFDGELAFEYDSPIRGPDSLTILTTSSRDGNSGNLLMFRDSFGNALYPYMADSFGHATFSRSMPYKLDLAGQREADFVVAELVERNLRYLVQNVPVMPAPERDVVRGVAVLSTAVISLEIEPAQSMPGYVLVKGVLSAEPDDFSPVDFYAGETCWESFMLEGGGFGLYIPENALNEDLFVVFAARGEAVCVAASALNEKGGS